MSQAYQTHKNSEQPQNSSSRHCKPSTYVVLLSHTNRHHSTDPQRIAAFTRAPPKLFEGAKEGAKFEIFGGNVSGSYTKLDRPTYVEQKWRLAQWPAGHFSTLKIKFEQNDVDAVTVMNVNWEGVPIGQEEPTKRNWNEYYVRSIKQTFGFGTIL